MIPGTEMTISRRSCCVYTISSAGLTFKFCLLSIMNAVRAAENRPAYTPMNQYDSVLE